MQLSRRSSSLWAYGQLNCDVRCRLDIDEARVAAVEHVCREYRDLVKVELCDLPQPSAYGFNPEGWAIFYVTEANTNQIGGGKYVAVDLTSGETKSLGVLGE